VRSRVQIPPCPGRPHAFFLIPCAVCRSRVTEPLLPASFCLSPAAPRIERAISDPRSKVREAAAIALGRAAGEEKADRLAEVARTDESADVRAAAVAALGRVYACDEMETLLAAMDDPDITVRRKANAAVTRVLDRRYEYHADDPPPKRRAVIAIIRKDWPETKAETVKYHAARRKKRED